MHKFIATLIKLINSYRYFQWDHFFFLLHKMILNLKHKIKKINIYKYSKTNRSIMKLQINTHLKKLYQLIKYAYIYIYKILLENPRDFL